MINLGKKMGENSAKLRKRKTRKTRRNENSNSLKQKSVDP